ncbi:MAG: hypothetical protein R2825_00220 [Saprospiraceae bacterium]
MKKAAIKSTGATHCKIKNTPFRKKNIPTKIATKKKMPIKPSNLKDAALRFTMIENELFIMVNNSYYDNNSLSANMFYKNT